MLMGSLLVILSPLATSPPQLIRALVWAKPALARGAALLSDRWRCCARDGREPHQDQHKGHQQPALNQEEANGLFMNVV